MKLAYGDDKELVRGDLAAHNGLEAGDDHSRDVGRVDGVMGHGGVGGFAKDADTQGVASGHDRAGGVANRAGAAGHDVLAKANIGARDAFNEVIGQHEFSPHGGFFGRLEKGEEGAGPGTTGGVEKRAGT